MHASKKFITRLASFIFCFVAIINGVNAQDGEAIFKQNCAVCHTIGGGRLVGPDLLGVTTTKSEEWLMKWIKSSQTLVKSGDADAKAICDEFGGMVMPDVALPDTEIKAILAFIASKGPAPVVAAKEVAAPKEEVAITKETSTTEEVAPKEATHTTSGSDMILYACIMGVIVAVTIILVLKRVDPTKKKDDHSA